MIPDRMFQVVYNARTIDGVSECRERHTVKPQDHDEKITFERVRDEFVDSKSKKLQRNVLVTGVTEVDADGNTLRIL